jgi:CelD/BcsL family acetyltransferase involved in cellulose biosynthesis
MTDIPLQRDAFNAVRLLPREPGQTAATAPPSVSQPHATPTTVRTEVAITLADIEALGPQWVTLDTATREPLFFQSFGWCRFLVQFHTRNQTARRPFAPRIITLWEGDQLRAVWPLQLRRASGHALLMDLGDPVNQYSGVVMAASCDPLSVVERLFGAARSIVGADGLLLRKTHVGRPLANTLALHGFKTGQGDAAPFVTLKGYSSFDAFYKTVLSRTRRNVRLGRERFEAVGQVEHHVCWGADEVSAALAQAMRLKQEWLDENGLTSTAFSDPTFRPMIEALARGEALGVELVAMVLSVNGQPASIHWGFVANKRYYLFMTARNQEFDEHAPGKLHFDYALKDCHALGLEIVDLLAPAVRYKLDWTKRVDEIQDYAVPFTWRGRLVLDGWQRRLRPATKRGFLRLPKSLRQGLARCLRR